MKLIVLSDLHLEFGRQEMFRNSISNVPNVPDPSGEASKKRYPFQTVGQSGDVWLKSIRRASGFWSATLRFMRQALHGKFLRTCPLCYVSRLARSPEAQQWRLTKVPARC